MDNIVKKYKSSSGLETDIVLGTGKTGSQKNMQLWSSNIYWVREDIRNIKASFIKLGFHLYEIKRCNAYCIYGYDDFYEFCDNNFHLSDSTVRRHIQLYKRFGEYRDGQCKMNIAREYEDYNYSQLCEMLPLTDGQAKKVKPDMTISEIREYKAGLRNNKNSDIICNIDKVINFVKNNNLCDVAQTEPLPDVETCKDDIVLPLFPFPEIDAVLNNVYDLKRFIDDKNYSMASASLSVLRDRLEKLFLGVL